MKLVLDESKCSWIIPGIHQITQCLGRVRAHHPPRTQKFQSGFAGTTHAQAQRNLDNELKLRHARAGHRGKYIPISVPAIEDNVLPRLLLPPPFARRQTPRGRQHEEHVLHIGPMPFDGQDRWRACCLRFWGQLQSLQDRAQSIPLNLGSNASTHAPTRKS